MKRKPLEELNLNETDIDAILSSLSLAASYPSCSSAQDDLNYSFCESAFAKISSRSPHLEPNEIRMISVGLTIALNYLSGQMPDLPFEIPEEDISELRRCFFSINRLEPIFRGYLEHFHT